MARYKDIEPIIEFIANGLNNPDKSKAFGHDAIEILTELEYAPTADVAEVVRCSECKHLEIINKEPIYGRCNKTGFEFKLWTVDTRESYCSGGEKKGGEE